MLYSVAAILAVATSVLAQTPGYHALVKPISNEVIPAGTTYTLEWTLSTLPSASGAVDLVLVGGSSAQTLQPLATIGSNIDPKLLKFDWAVDASLGKDKAYGVKIQLHSDATTYQWSNPFTISPSGGSDNSSTTTTSDSSSTTASPSDTTSYSKTVTSTPIGNLSTSTGAPTRTLTTTTGGSGPTGSQTTTSRTSISSGGAATAFAGSFAVLGGVAMAAVMGL